MAADFGYDNASVAIRGESGSYNTADIIGGTESECSYPG